MMSNSFDIRALDQLEAKLRKVMPDLPKIAGNEIINFSLDNFKRQGFLGNSFQRWPARKSTAWGRKRQDNKRAILIQTSRLRRATRIIQADWQQVKAINDVPYAKAHNEGWRGSVVQKVGAHTRRRFTTAKVPSLKTKKTSTKKVVGGNVRVSAHTRTIKQRIPKRTFLASSPYLSNNIRRAIAAHISKSMR